MAFLTEYSYGQLIERIEIENIERIDKQFFKTNIFDNDYLFYFFNQFDLKKLFTEKIILSENKTYTLVFKKVPVRKDNKNYVIAIKGNVKYHKNSECTALNKGFKNFYMPEVVVRLEQKDPEKHERLVKDIREWFEKNNYTVSRYELGEINDKILTKDFNSTFPEKYGIESISISQSDKNQFKWYIEKRSTGTVGTDLSFDYNAFIIRISELLKQREVLCSSRTMKSLARYDFLKNKDDVEISEYISKSIHKGYLIDVSDVFIDNYGIDKLKAFWGQHILLKREASNLLSKYFKWTYNYNGEAFDEVFLEDFQLKACHLCY